MAIQRKIFLVFFSFLLTIPSLLFALNINDTAPDFALENLNEKKVALTDLIGTDGNVVIVSFFNSECAPCKKELPHLQNIYYKFEGRGVRVRLINIGESIDTIRQYKKKFTVEIPILVDSEGLLSGNYGANSLPYLFVISKNKVIKKIIKGYDENIENTLTETINLLLKEEKVNIQDKQITFFYGNSANGYLESCDCPDNPFGGLIRMSSLMDKLTVKNTVKLYTGDFFNSRDTKINKIKNKYCMQAMALMNFSAICPGDQEFSSGYNFLIDNLNSLSFEKIPFVASNLSVCDEKQCYNISQPYKIKQIGDYRVAFIGILSPKTFVFFPKEQKNHIKITASPIETLSKLVPELKTKADFICVLLHEGETTANEIIQTVPGIDIIFSGHSQTKTDMKINNTLVLEAGENGSYLGQCVVTFDHKKNVVSYDNKLIPLTKDIPDDPNIKKLIDEMKQELKNQAKTAVA